jgi:uncharacterized protein CbrC (UPF0167 family)
MSRMSDLYGHAYDWAVWQGLSEDIAHRFAFYRTDGYHLWTDEDWDYECATPHPVAWRAYCESEDRSPATGERYVMDHLTYVSRHGVA